MLGETGSAQGYNPQSFPLSPLEGKASSEECEGDSSPSEKLLIGSLPHEYAKEHRKPGSLEAINLRMKGEQYVDLRSQLKHQNISFKIPEDQNHSSKQGFPLTVELSLSESDRTCCYIKCKDSKEKISVTVTDNAGNSIENKIIAGFSINQGENDYYVLDYGEKRLMEYCVSSDAKVKSSTLQVMNHTLEDVSHLEQDPHDDMYYGTFNAVMVNGQEVPATFVECPLDEWNAPCSSIGKMFRAVLGLISNGSQNPDFSRRSSDIRLLISVACGFACVQLGDMAAAAAQARAGYKQVSFTGTDASNPDVEQVKAAGLFCGITFALTCGSIKEAKGVESGSIFDKKQIKQNTREMFFYEAGGFQFGPGILMVTVAVAADQLLNNGEGINPAKMLIDSTMTQTIINGFIGAGIQAKLIRAGYHPLVAWLGYFSVRAVPFRFANLWMQHLTTKFIVGCSDQTNASNSTWSSMGNGTIPINNGSTPLALPGNGTTVIYQAEPGNFTITGNDTLSGNATTSGECGLFPSWEASKPVLIAQYVNEAILSSFNVSTYFAGAFKRTDGSEEQSASYCEKHNIPLNPFNKLRVGIQKWLDGRYEVTRKCLANFACTPLGASVFGLSDYSFVSLNQLRERNMSPQQPSLQERDTKALNV